MTATLATLRPGTLAHARIVFRVDLRDARSAEIPLAVLAELIVPGYRCFGITVRRHLTPDELGQLPSSWKNDLAQPAVFLDAEFNRAWVDAKPGEAIEFLAARHWTSLLVQSPRQIRMPPEIIHAPANNLVAVCTAQIVELMRTQAVDLFHSRSAGGLEDVEQTLKAAA